jgi:hypothetical protein
MDITQNLLGQSELDLIAAAQGEAAYDRAMRWAEEQGLFEFAKIAASRHGDKSSSPTEVSLHLPYLTDGELAVATRRAWDLKRKSTAGLRRPGADGILEAIARLIVVARTEQDLREHILVRITDRHDIDPRVLLRAEGDHLHWAVALFVYGNLLAAEDSKRRSRFIQAPLRQDFDPDRHLLKYWEGPENAAGRKTEPLSPISAYRVNQPGDMETQAGATIA